MKHLIALALFFFSCLPVYAQYPINQACRPRAGELEVGEAFMVRIPVTLRSRLAEGNSETLDFSAESIRVSMSYEIEYPNIRPLPVGSIFTVVNSNMLFAMLESASGKTYYFDCKQVRRRFGYDQKSRATCTREMLNAVLFSQVGNSQVCEDITIESASLIIPNPEATAFN